MLILVLKRVFNSIYSMTLRIELFVCFADFLFFLSLSSMKINCLSLLFLINSLSYSHESFENQSLEAKSGIVARKINRLSKIKLSKLFFVLKSFVFTHRLLS